MTLIKRAGLKITFWEGVVLRLMLASRLSVQNSLGIFRMVVRKMTQDHLQSWSVPARIKPALDIQPLQVDG